MGIRFRETLAAGLQDAFPNRQSFFWLFLALLLALTCAIYVSWSGNSFGVIVFAYCVFCIGCPITIILVSVLWRIKHRIAQLGKRVALQIFLFCTALIPLAIVSMRVEYFAEKVGQHRGRDAVVWIEKFKATHGTYPETLDQMIRWDKMPLRQSPTDPEGWHYSRGEDTYSLQYRGGFFQIFTFDSKHRVWLHD